MRRLPLTVAVLVLLGIAGSVFLYWDTMYSAITLERCTEVRDGLPVISYHRKRFGEHQGKLHGSYLVWRRTTDLRVLAGEYRNGEPHGLWRYWDEQGRLTHYESPADPDGETPTDAHLQDQTAPPLDDLLETCQQLCATTHTPEQSLRACYWFIKERVIACSYEKLRKALLQQGAVRELEQEGIHTTRLVVVIPVPQWGWLSPELPVEFLLEIHGYPQVHAVEVRLRVKPRDSLRLVANSGRYPPSVLLVQSLRHPRFRQSGKALPVAWTLTLGYGERIHRAGQRGTYLASIDLRDRKDVLCCQSVITLSSLSGLDPTTDRRGVEPLEFEPKDTFGELTVWLERHDPGPHDD